MLEGLNVNFMITSSTTLCPELSAYPSPSSSNKMVEMLGANFSTTSGTGVKNRSRGRRAKKGQETSWVYLNALEDFSDIRTRNRLMNAYNSSSSDDEPVPRSVASVSTVSSQAVNELPTTTSHFHPNLHALHKFRRERKKGLVSDKNVVISYRPRARLSLLSRRNFFYRVSNKELEALQAFSFLDDISISISSPEEENEASGIGSEYLFSMDYEKEQDDEQIQVIPMLITVDNDDELERDEIMPNIENASLTELIPEVIDGEMGRCCEVYENDDVKNLETTEVVIHNMEERDCLVDSLSWTEEQDLIVSLKGDSTEKHDKIQVMKTDITEVNSDPVEDDGFHDRHLHAPPSPPLSVVLDRLSLSDSCTESYFGSDSGGSSFLGGK